jgi:hypothetical protein
MESIKVPVFFKLRKYRYCIERDPRMIPNRIIVPALREQIIFRLEYVRVAMPVSNISDTFVMDNGAYTIKAGLSSQSSPRYGCTVY